MSFQYGNEFNKSMMNNLESREYLMAFKYGYLLKKSKTWYKSWGDRFFVLSNIGIIIMYKPSDVEVQLFPFVDFEVIEVDEGVYDKKWVFTLRTIKGKDFDLIVQAYSK